MHHLALEAARYRSHGGYGWYLAIRWLFAKLHYWAWLIVAPLAALGIWGNLTSSGED
jgi:hypothetical protein